MMFNNKLLYLKNAVYFFISLILIFGIGKFIYSFPFNSIVLIGIKIIYWFYTVLLLTALAMRLKILLRKWIKVRARGENILIVAPHQDDCVAMAGGFAIQTLLKKGKVNIVYVTEEEGEYGLIRKKEAFRAWECVGLDRKAIQFLGYRTLSGLILRNEIDECIQKMIALIALIKPDIIFVPAYEGGHYQHDVTNYIVNRALKKTFLKNIRVFETALYNFYYSINRTPEKVIASLRIFIPFGKRHYPPEPIRRDPVYILNMTNDELKMKSVMLNQFVSQNPNTLISRFGYPDRFQKYREYDYSKSPFDYDHSPAKVINFLKTLPIIGKVISNEIKWTNSIHPNPNYTITKIPL